MDFCAAGSHLQNPFDSAILEALDDQKLYLQFMQMDRRAAVLRLGWICALTLRTAIKVFRRLSICPDTSYLRPPTLPDEYLTKILGIYISQNQGSQSTTR